MELAKNGLPTEEGIYFITEDNRNYWVGVVKVTGKTPFLNVKVLARFAKTTDLVNVDKNEMLLNPETFHYSECLDYKHIKE